ncbi:Sec-independent protein translocase protein TatB [Candidatus Poriferisocius sp.]|uniref:Sec-independent protein translocase protein TatB n=1 Tax=Candidatus Poriferisocius sp. TaxID=3101276 RepID=UPI003B5A9093
MGNLGWAEIAVIMVVALVVLGPDKLPAAARQVGNVVRQLRKISTGFQQELQNALDEPIEAEARRRGHEAVAQGPSESPSNGDPPAPRP